MTMNPLLTVILGLIWKHTGKSQTSVTNADINIEPFEFVAVDVKTEPEMEEADHENSYVDAMMTNIQKHDGKIISIWGWVKNDPIPNIQRANCCMKACQNIDP